MPEFKVHWSRRYYKSGIKMVEAVDVDQAYDIAEQHIDLWSETEELVPEMESDDVVVEE